MKLSSASWLCVLGGVTLGAAIACGNNNPTTTSDGGTTSSSSSGSGSGSGSSSSGGGSGSGSGGSGSSGSADAGPLPLCMSGLQDGITGCMATDPTCVKGCGPDMVGGVNNNLGSKSCSCNTGPMTYKCAMCGYPSPPPPCYAAPATPPACAAGVANKGACTAMCSGVCTLYTDAGKLQGCVCVANSAGALSWTCATSWW